MPALRALTLPRFITKAYKFFAVAELAKGRTGRCSEPHDQGGENGREIPRKQNWTKSS